MSPAAPNPALHRFSWDGLSIEIPTDWNLAHYRFSRSGSQVRLEDDESLRLQMDWIHTRRPVSSNTLEQRVARQSRAVAAAAIKSIPVPNMPAAWSARLHTLPDGRHLAIASRLSRNQCTVVVLQLLAEREPEPATMRRLRAVTASFVHHEGTTIPWRVYDVAFDLPRQWWLIDTAFAAGSKRFLFQLRLRRLHIWQCAVASIALRGRTPAQFAVDLLRTHRPLRNHRFIALDQHRLALDPRRRWPILPADDLGRACLRYSGSCILLPNQDSLFLSLFNYRTPSDIAALRPHLPPDRFPWIHAPELAL